MGIKILNPTSPGRRFQTRLTFEEITKTTPERSLVEPLKSSGGRNVYGRVTTRHRGGGCKRQYRVIDFKRDKHGVPARVAAIEYDPNRSCNIALLHYMDGEKRYIIAPHQLHVFDEICSGPGCEIKVGNALPLKEIPLGTHVHNIELKPGKGGQLARSAGTYGQLMAKEGKYAQIKLPSSEVRRVLQECKATIGQTGNLDHHKVSIGKAGRSRYLGKRPSVRGVAMNPVDHPMGGGEGKSSGGRHPCTPWGKPTKGYRTRTNKTSGKFIVRPRTR